MITSETKKNRYYFELFSKSFKELPQGKVIYSDKPDVIIDGIRKIGIEVTNFYLESGKLPESEQSQRKRREDVVNRAHKEYLGKGGKKIELSFSFDKNNPITKKDRLVRRIVEVTKQIEGFDSREINKHLYEDIKEINSIYVNSRQYDNPKWRIVQKYKGKNISQENLFRIIQEKETKSKEYQKCDEYWLLIVVDFSDRAQDQEIRIDGLEMKSSAFKKIILYKTVFNHIVSIC